MSSAHTGYPKATSICSLVYGLCFKLYDRYLRLRVSGEGRCQYMLTIGIADPTRCTAEGKMILMLDGLAETAEGAVRVRVGVRI